MNPTPPAPVVWSVPSATLVRMIGQPVCPDLLEYGDLGDADGARGRVVRGFFWLLDRVWRPRP